MKENILKAYNAAKTALTWVEENKSLEQDLLNISDELNTDICRFLNEAKAAINCVDSKSTTIGVFGPSQAGKSYLVSNMAASNGVLNAVLDGEQINFLAHINPQGQDKEATGFVTRFTHQAIKQVPKFPITARVFREIEIAAILLNSFYADLNKDQVSVDFTEQLLLDHLKECEQFIQDKVDNAISIEDIVFFADYAQEHSDGKLVRFDANSTFYQKARLLVPRLSLKGRAYFFSIFWGRFSAFTNMYEIISNELLKLKGNTTVYVPLAAFVENIDGRLMQRKEGTIISITSLQQIFNQSNTIKICLDDEGLDIVELDFAKFAAVCLEILFPLSNGSHVDCFDVIDFPGARARNSIDVSLLTKATSVNYEVNAKDKELSLEFLRRGKVAYLFDRYTKNKEVDVLLLCLGAHAQQEVVSLVNIMRKWVEKNLGATPQARTKYEQNPPLIGVLTRFDSVFNNYVENVLNGITPKPTDAIDACFERFGKEAWMNNFTKGLPFCNFYLARKPNIRLNWIERNSTDTQELAIKDDFIDTINKCKLEISNCANFKRYIKDPNKALDAVLSLNDGGVGFITENLIKNFKQNDLKDQRVIKPLALKAKEIILRLESFAAKEGLAAASEARQRGIELTKNFLQLNDIANIFSRIRNCLELDYDVLFEKYNEGNASDINAKFYSGIALDMYVERVKELSSDTFLKELYAFVNKAWKTRLTGLLADENSKDNYSFFYDSSAARFKDEKEINKSVELLIKQITDEILKAVYSKQINIQEHLVNELLVNEVEYQALGRQRRIMQVQLVLRFFSDFSCFLGTNLLKVKVNNLFIKENTSLNESKFITVKDNAYRAGCLAAEVLPILDDRTKNYQKHFITGFFSSLIYIMENVNINSQSLYSFSKESNEVICQVLAFLDFLEK